MRRAFRWLARRKGGQSAWTPASTFGGASAPGNSLSLTEFHAFVYRPLPMEHTVEYEEDVGHNAYVQREYYHPSARKDMSWDLVPLAGSDLELRRGREKLATIANREEAQSAAAAGSPEAVNLQVDETVNERGIGELKSVRYIFDSQRVAFCERFRRYFTEPLLRRKDTLLEETDSRTAMLALMEVCAIIHGCSTDEGREAFYRRFMSLDRVSLEDEAEEHRRMLAIAEKQKGRIPRDECTTADDDDEEEEEGSSTEHLFHLPDEFAEFAPMLDSYKAFASGEIRTAPSAVSAMRDMAREGQLLTRRRWRAIIEKLVAEEYDRLDDSERREAVVLNEQLRTLKFLDARVGETVREIVALAQRETGGTVHAPEPSDRSLSHPDGRESLLPHMVPKMS